MSKKVIKRNLAIDTTYTLVNAYYTGGMAEGDMEVCENCCAFICNIAVVRNASGKTFHVGMDCAETLSGIGKTENFGDAKMNMRTAVDLVKKIREMKDNGTLKVTFSTERGYETVFVEGKVGKKVNPNSAGYLMHEREALAANDWIKMDKFCRNIWEKGVMAAMPIKLIESFKTLANA